MKQALNTNVNPRSMIREVLGWEKNSFAGNIKGAERTFEGGKEEKS